MGPHLSAQQRGSLGLGWGWDVVRGQAGSHCEYCTLSPPDSLVLGCKGPTPSTFCRVKRPQRPLSCFSKVGMVVARGRNMSRRWWAPGHLSSMGEASCLPWSLPVPFRLGPAASRVPQSSESKKGLPGSPRRSLERPRLLSTQEGFWGLAQGHEETEPGPR